MSEDGSTELIDKIGKALELLRGKNEGTVQPRGNEIEIISLTSPVNNSSQEVTSVENTVPLDNMEIEHVNLDHRGNVIRTSNEGAINPSGNEVEIISPAPPVNSLSQEVTSVEDTVALGNMEIEHIYLDYRGKVIRTSTEIVPKENSSIESRKGKAWTADEESLIRYYFLQGKDFSTIAELIGRTEVAIKSRLAKLGLIEYTYGQEDVSPSTSTEKPKGRFTFGDFVIDNQMDRAYILNKNGEMVFSIDGKLKVFHGKLYRLIVKKECFTMKRMIFDGSVWMRGAKKIVAFPRSRLFQILNYALEFCDMVEDIIDSSIFEECQVKADGVWYNYKGEAIIKSHEQNGATRDSLIRKTDIQQIKSSPLYAVRRQAILRAMTLFRIPATIKDVSRAISRTAWRSAIKEEEVEAIINTITEVESSNGKYYLRKRP